MIIIAGTLRVAERDAYLAAVAHVAGLARAFPGCLAFVQAADPLEADAIHIYERWESDEALHAFRNSGGPPIDAPPISSASVAKYRISAVERP